MKNIDVMRMFYGKDLTVKTAVSVLTADHPCCCFCVHEHDQKNCKMECEEGVEGWLLKEAEEDG